MTIAAAPTAKVTAGRLSRIARDMVLSPGSRRVHAPTAATGAEQARHRWLRERPWRRQPQGGPASTGAQRAVVVRVLLCTAHAMTAPARRVLVVARRAAPDAENPRRTEQRRTARDLVLSGRPPSVPVRPQQPPPCVRSAPFARTPWLAPADGVVVPQPRDDAAEAAVVKKKNKKTGRGTGRRGRGSKRRRRRRRRRRRARGGGRGGLRPTESQTAAYRFFGWGERK